MVAPEHLRAQLRGCRLALPAVEHRVTVLTLRLGISVMSPTQRVFRVEAVKSRLNRSANFGAVLSWRVRPLRRRIRRATRCWRRIDSATVFTDTTQPSSRRSASSRGFVVDREQCRQVGGRA